MGLKVDDIFDVREKIQIELICNNLLQGINHELYKYNYFNSESDYEKCFTSVDLIIDCQMAIDEFTTMAEEQFSDNSRLHIYGILQVIYAQQNGLMMLYKTIFGYNTKTQLNDFFAKFNYNAEHRKIRNKICHSNDSKGENVYWITPIGASKYQFTYAGYECNKFIKENVDLKDMIEEQSRFAILVLNKIKDIMEEKICQYAKDNQE